MLETALSFITGVVGMMVILGLWLLLQSVVRKNSGCGPGKDVLDYLGHGCGGCKGSTSCSRRKIVTGVETPESESKNHELI